MSEATMQLLQPLFALPPDERLEAAQALQESVPFEIDPAFDAVLDRRRREIESGQEKGIPAEEVFRRVREGRP
ncbi:MAG TPA: addiction module protein [Urbifossiella sp.]|nr:addiction module protein [Urbifossiella sp.]